MHLRRFGVGGRWLKIAQSVRPSGFGQKKGAQPKWLHATSDKNSAVRKFFDKTAF